jgi:adenylate cyclase
MPQRRKLAAILAADVVGYSRLMADDERATIETLNAYRRVFRDRVAAHEGRVVDSPGDALLAEFPSAVEGVQCAAEIQHELARRNLQLAEHRRMYFRIGINLGDVVEEDDALYGDGVNVAARLEALADPGGICISGTAFDQVDGKVSVGFKFFGEQQVKNIPKPIRAYRLAAADTDGRSPSATFGRKPQVLILTLALVVAAAVGLFTWYVVRAPSTRIAEPQDDLPALPVSASIAVLPFTNLSGEATQEYFADGLAEDILTRLSRFSDIKVIGRNSSFKYKGTAVDVRAVGRELGVAYVLEGSVRRTAEKIRVTAQLLETKEGAHLWADSYDLPTDPARLFAAQDAITDRVAATLADTTGVISRVKFGDSIGKPAADITSYDCILRARAFNAGYTAELHLLARTCLETVVKREPGLAEAWAWLAVVYADEHAAGFNSRGKEYQPLESAVRAAERAVQLEHSNQLAHYALAYANFFRHDLSKVLREGEIAVRLNPNNATVLSILGTHLVFAGSDEAGKQLIERAVALNPFLPPETGYQFAYSHYYYRRGEYEKALAAIQTTNLPDFVWTHILVAATYAQLGRMTEANAAARRLQELQPDFSLVTFEEEARVWNLPQPAIAQLAEGLRKAGIPERS